MKALFCCLKPSAPTEVDDTKLQEANRITSQNHSLQDEPENEAKLYSDDEHNDTARKLIVKQSNGYNDKNYSRFVNRKHFEPLNNSAINFEIS